MREKSIIICSVETCQAPSQTRGWCKHHYDKWLRYRDPLHKQPTLEERFWLRVNKNGPIPANRPELGPCWLWKGTITFFGYSHFWINHKEVRAHRFSYKLLIGAIPDGLHLDHLCRVRSCVNPYHLEPVTNRINILRGDAPAAINARKTHCIHGHPFDAVNTWHYKGFRFCKTCRRRRLQSWRHNRT